MQCPHCFGQSGMWLRRMANMKNDTTIAVMTLIIMYFISMLVCNKFNYMVQRYDVGRVYALPPLNRLQQCIQVFDVFSYILSPNGRYLSSCQTGWKLLFVKTDPQNARRSHHFHQIKQIEHRECRKCAIGERGKRAKQSCYVMFACFLFLQLPRH